MNRCFSRCLRLSFGVIFLCFFIFYNSPLPQRTKRETSSTSSFIRSILPVCNRSEIPPPLDVDDDGQFPPDYFTLEQRQKGAVFFHLCGLIYMFVALAIVCDEFFVPSLAVLTEKLSISDDVAGATFMAAGGSAPEFFTSVIGVFIAQNNVGIGTIVGSATFNILCVLACCTLFSTTVLELTWWPLFRDVSIYIIALVMLVIFFLDEKITWPEAAALFCVYLIYCIIMKYNVKLEILARKLVGDVKEEIPIDIEQQPTTNLVNNTQQNGRPISPVIANEHRDIIDDTKHERSHSLRRRSSMGRRQSIPILHSGTMFRTGIMQLMNHTLEQLPEGESEEDESGRLSEAKRAVSPPQKQTELTLPDKQMERRSSQIEEIKSILEEEDEKPLDMEWPDEWGKRITYVCLAPILIPMWVTIPDVRRQGYRCWYPVTFMNSILWIAFFSYLMVWWANTIGETLVIPTEIIGLTILAAGTSIPDLITSVIVARKGLGDMAVSSSVGSNIFDVCVGLPVPWLMFFIIEPIRNPSFNSFISVSSKGLLCSVGMLFIMLVVLVFSIFVSNWKMNKAFGVIMIVSYVAFCIFSVGLETDRLKCPLNLC